MPLQPDELLYLTKLTNAQRGHLAELIFTRKASSLGFSVAKPWAEGERYDSIVRMDSLMFRVQVKSVLSKSPSRPHFRVQTTGARKRHKRGFNHYTSDQIDFLAAYIFSEDIWYIFPAEVVQGKTCICLFPGSKRSSFEAYREAWGLMKPALVEVVPEQGIAAIAHA